MESIDRRATVLGFLLTAVILGVLVFFVGVDDLIDELQRADPMYVGIVMAAALGWMFMWGLSLRTVLNGLGTPVSAVRGFLLYAGAAFSNNITPFGQAGGEPVTALIFTRATDMEYERGLASIATVDALNFVPSSVFIIFGVAYYATETTFGRNVFLAVGFMIAMSVIIPIFLYYIWSNRNAVEDWIAGLVTPLVRIITSKLPNKTPPNNEDIKHRVEQFFESLEKIGSDPKTLGKAVLFSGIGWVLQSVALWMALRSVGILIPFSATLFIVPLGGIAGVTPLPGGTGGIETILIGLILTISSASLTNATAAVIIFRGSVYWMPILIGGLFAGFEIFVSDKD